MMSVIMNIWSFGMFKWNNYIRNKIEIKLFARFSDCNNFSSRMNLETGVSRNIVQKN